MIRTIAVRTALDHCRKKRIIFEDISYHEVYQSNGEVNALSQLEVEDMLNIITTIPDKLRIVFNMYEVDGFNHKEIGAILNITESTSRCYLTRAKKGIQKILKDITVVNFSNK